MCDFILFFYFILIVNLFALSEDQKNIYIPTRTPTQPKTRHKQEAPLPPPPPPTTYTYTHTHIHTRARTPSHPATTTPPPPPPPPPPPTHTHTSFALVPIVLEKPALRLRGFLCCFHFLFSYFLTLITPEPNQS